MTISPHADFSQRPHPLQGECRRCGKEHSLCLGRAPVLGAGLMMQLISRGCLDGGGPRPATGVHSTLPLFGENRGKMLGVLEGVDACGKPVVLRAFSGQFNGLWNIDGWVPPLFDIQVWQEENTRTEKEIKHLGAVINQAQENDSTLLFLKRRRKLLSRKLMARLHELYHLQNFRGERAALGDFFTDRRGIPTGAGDCCAPKLLNYAVLHDIIPFGITEFYWGRTTRSKDRVHGRFYPACTEKCLPLMGFLLCGLEERQRQRIS